MTATTTSYRIFKSGECYGVRVDGEEVIDSLDTLEEAREEVKRMKREALVADLREQVGQWVDSFDGDDTAEAIRKLKRALKVLES